MSEEKRLEIHNTLYKYCSDFLNVQEITHAANIIIDNPTEDGVLEATTYLDSFDTARYGTGAGQSYLLPTTTTRGLTSNNVRFAMSEIRTLISEVK